MIAKRSRHLYILYVIFAAYVTVVMLFLASMLLRSTAGKKSGMKGLPRYMSDEEIGVLKIKEDGTLNEQLRVAFQKADENGNGYLERQELIDWIHSKVSEHISVAVKSNFKVFLTLDKTPKDGWISMNEYVAYFISSRGVKAENELPRPAREQLMSERAEFYEIANDEEQVTIDELLRFRHPETSHSHLLDKVTELVDDFDQDGDGALSADELLELSDPAYRPTDEQKALFPVHSPDEMRALHARLDTDSNKQLNQHELLVFIDPRHAHHAERDAARLLEVAGAAAAGRLSLSEVQRHAQEFRMLVDARHKFHQPEDQR